MALSVSVCPGCGTVNPADHNFCSHCGVAMRTSRCSVCGARNPIGTTVCDSCGALVREQADQPLPDQRDERKFVTAFFADIKGSVELLGKRDIEEGRHIIDSVILQISSLVNRYGGTVVDTVGDGVFAIFGAPRSLDGHPRAAVDAALEIQEQMRVNDQPDSLFADIQLRIGIYSGDVIWRVLQVGRELRHLPVGLSVNQASRFQEAAEPGTVLIGETTYELVKDYFSFRVVCGLHLKGIPGSVNAYQVLKQSDVFRNLQVSIKRGLSPLVGRDCELHILAESIQSLDRGKGRVLILVSDAGGGKSRLLHEATASLPPNYSVLEAFCIAHMQSSPWYCVIQLIRDLFELSSGMPSHEAKLQVMSKIPALDPSLEEDLPTLLQFLDLDQGSIVPATADPTVRRRKYISLIQRLLVLRSQSCPLIVMIEDLHWLDLQSADVVDAIWSITEEHPILLLCTTRPEGLKSEWQSQQDAILHLPYLDLPAARQLIMSLLPSEVLNERTILEIQHKTQGNPFFIEEVIRSLPLSDVVDANLTDVAIHSLSMPSTIKMAIADRIDRLPQKEKKYLQMLAVVGMKCRVFLFARLIAEDHDSVVDTLSSLQRLGFVARSKLDQQLFVQFGHVLTQEVAYSTLLSDSRAMLHEYIADTMKAEYAELTVEIVPELAYHYQHSANDRMAVEHLRLAGELAIQRSAHQEAQNYLKLALARLGKSRRIPDKFSHLAHLWLSLGVSLQVTLGYAADEVRTAYEHAVDYSERAKDSTRLLEALRGYGIFNIVKANYIEAAKIAERLKRFANGDPAFALEHLILSGLSCSYRGEIIKGAKYYKKGLSITSRPVVSTTIQYSGYSPGICYSYYALNALYAGRLRLARDYAKKGVEVAFTSGIPIAVAQSRGMLANVLFSFCEFTQAEEQHQVNVAFSHENGFAYWSLLGRLLITWTNGFLRDDQSTLDEFQAYVTAYRGSGALIGVPWFLNLYAELLWHFGRTREALVVLGESEGIASLTQERFFLVDTLRLKGELHAALSADPTSVVAAQCFREAINLARVQGAWLPGVRAAMPLARLLIRQGDFEEARELVRFHYKKLSWIKCPDYEHVRALIQDLSLDL
ncbi:MAG: adenylate/guanylate cyclase domain-containing protein [Cyanobacteriota bacterium]|nr:adenylate/guanylate cyclase domain-containing protein [Cyanobacteriota bacterium]